MHARGSLANFSRVVAGLVAMSLFGTTAFALEVTSVRVSETKSPSANVPQKTKTERQTLEPVSRRFTPADVKEVPSFRRHVVPLLGKLGCNGRACHGSFQGRGGFRLSLFGYDFKMDHQQLLAGDEPRVNPRNPDASLILQKPTLQIPHEGGLRYKLGSWEHHVLLRWIQGGAVAVKDSDPQFVRISVSPSELRFSKKGEHVALKVIAPWSDGTREDVTPLCRYQTQRRADRQDRYDGSRDFERAGRFARGGLLRHGRHAGSRDAARFRRGRAEVSRRPHADRN